jgi:primosomal protein N' (replication factor Y)
MNFVRVALDVPLPTLFDYRADGVTRADIGYRVLVPFGKKLVTGVIVEVAADSEIPEHRLRRVDTILRDVPPLPGEWIAQAKFCSGYYHAPIGEVVMAALPPRLRGGKSVPRAAPDYAITPAGKEALATLPKRKKRLREFLEGLARGPAAASEPFRGTGQAVKRCIEAGWIAAVVPQPSALHFVAAHTLTSEQRDALDSLRDALGKFGVSLLFGVTGSGKTEIYLQLVAEILKRGRQALVLVPEIALTPSLESAFRERFRGAGIAIQTSAMPEGERARAWLDAHCGRADIVLGTRLAIFTPLPRLGLVVVDEEQDASYKQQEGLRYSARDLAIARGHAAGAPVLLCSATPSLETFNHAASGKYKLIRLKRRAIEQASLPSIRLIDTREHPLRDGLTAPLVDALAGRVARGELSLVFLNRRGYAPVLACPACGWVKDCRRCSAHMVVHLSERRMRCHHCGLAEDIPRACPQCGNPDMQPFGRGTQRVEATLAEKFPQARVLRMDSDSARARGKLEDLLARAAQADILVGTQILAKGHHFERLTLVGVLNADSGLFAGDYRASERTFAQLQQVAGRSGRANLPGEVMIQTRYPDHPLYRSLVNHDFEGFAQVTLAERRQAGFPPFVFEAALRAEGDDPQRVLRFLKSAIASAPEKRPSVTVYDPAPMSLARLAGLERAQVLLQAGSRPRLQAFLNEWDEALYRLPAQGVRWHIDVDPIEF